MNIERMRWDGEKEQERGEQERSKEKVQRGHPSPPFLAGRDDSVLADGGEHGEDGPTVGLLNNTSE